VKRFRSLKHNTSIGTNGVIEIQTTDEGKVLFTKPGADGQEVGAL
jgi:hypothetical protein